MRFLIYNTGTCTRVKLYGEDVRNLCLLNGWEETKEFEKADYIFINTCSFLKSKSDYFLSRVRECHSNIHEGQTLVIVGCLGGTNSHEIKEINPDILIFKRDLSEIQEAFHFSLIPKSVATNVSEKLPPQKKALQLFNQNILKSKHIDFRLKKDNVCYIQIATGCLGKCSYCSEKFITKLKSRPLDEILEAVQDGIQRGFTLFSLSSDDASAYGKDIGTSLDELLSALCKIKEDIYFIIPEFNPQGLTDSVLESLKDPKFLYITVPVQSGSQKILNKMKRPYRIASVLKKIQAIKKNNPDIMINTHVIVGFPSETNEEFNMTIKLIRTGLFDRVKVFVYSDRPGTEASAYPDCYKISDKEKQKRRQKILNEVRICNLKKGSLTNLILNLDQIKE